MEKIPLFDLEKLLIHLEADHVREGINESYFNENFSLLKANICPKDKKTEERFLKTISIKSVRLYYGVKT